MKLTDNAYAVLQKRYLARDAEDHLIEDAEGLFRRVAAAVARADAAYDVNADIAGLAQQFYDTMTSLEFLPNSPTLMNAGRPLGQLSACFVLPIDDSLESIFEAVKQAALIHQSGGGTGFAFSRLRSSGSVVRSTGGVASGPISFMKVFNAATEAIKQGGTRRGANMGVLRVDHPDILSFIDCKQDVTQITNFNISVGVTDAFMQAVAQDGQYDLVNPSTGQVVNRLSARMVYNHILEAAWRNGEPGILFLDRINKGNPVPSQGAIEATNPCGEQPLMPFESCNLGSINLANMLGQNGVNWQKLGRTTQLAVHFLDNVIDINRYPLEKIDMQTKLTRKIGLGVMGWADMLFALGLRYDSEEAVALGERIMKFIRDTGVAESERLASIRGAFPLCPDSVFTKPRRNATITTIAPTGTLSLIAGASSGIEPAFALSFTRNVMDGAKLVEFNPVVAAMMEQAGVDTPEKLHPKIQDVLVTAHQVSPEWHVRMQAAFQKHTDNAVSKTVNFSNEATVEEVRTVYDLAYRLGCKGVTIYRDGSRFGQVLTTSEKPEPVAAPDICDISCDDCRLPTPAKVQTGIVPRPRPTVTQGITERMTIGCGNLYVTVNLDDNGICEVFTNTGKKGGCPSQSEATARLATTAFRAGVAPEYIVKQLKGIRCPSTIRQKGHQVLSCPDAIARVIMRVLNMKSEALEPDVMDVEETDETVYRPCPECGKSLEHAGGCVMCRHCGYSKCG